jgi:hypothetical protein
VSGIDATPIGTLAPAAGNFTSLSVGSTTPIGVFTVGLNGTPSQAPGFYSLGTGALTIASLTSGYGTSLTLENGAGAASTITTDGSYAMDFAGTNGTTFLTKPANSAYPYFASGLGIGTTSPGSLLSVGNTNGINFSTATSTFSTTGGINLARIMRCGLAGVA